MILMFVDLTAAERWLAERSVYRQHHRRAKTDFGKISDLTAMATWCSQSAVSGRCRCPSGSLTAHRWRWITRTCRILAMRSSGVGTHSSSAADDRSSSSLRQLLAFQSGTRLLHESRSTAAFLHE
jgi:hypothetical protein